MAKATTKPQPWKDEGLNKAEWVAREVAKAVNAGKAWDLETVDFSDSNRPLTCLEVDFPIIPVNQVASIEGSSGSTRKPVYQMSKWWARRNSSVFRAMLLAAAIKAPDDPTEAAKLVWDVYYGNHQKQGAFKHLKVADIFMGGGTTIVEGSRLGMQMYGNDLNPVAWFVVKNELAQVNKAEVEALLAEIEAEVKPQIMPFYACDCPRGHKGKWTQLSTGQQMGDDFDPLSLTPDQRKDYRYEGPEVIYTFWAKHGPCQVTGCGHRTPIMSSPLMAVKTLSINAWKRKCKHCGEQYDIEEREARMAPGVEMVVAETEKPYAVATLNYNDKPELAICPHCGEEERFGSLGKSDKKKVELSLLVHPDWLKGVPSTDEQGKPYGGSVTDPIEATIRWNNLRAANCKLIEVRGSLPSEVQIANGKTIRTGKEGGNVPGNSQFTCQQQTCGQSQLILRALQHARRNAPVAMYALQGYCPSCNAEGEAYNGRFFIPANDASVCNAASSEWFVRRDTDLVGSWPHSDIPFGDRTHVKDPLPKHGFHKWSDLFLPRQLLVHSLLLRSIIDCGHKRRSRNASDFVLGAFQQYLRNQSIFAIWNLQADQLEPLFSNNNFNPKNTFVENGVFARLGRGNWESQRDNLLEAIDWGHDPSELVDIMGLAEKHHALGNAVTGKSERVYCGDPLIHGETLACMSASEQLRCGSSTELQALLPDSSCDLIITDPPFGGILQYAELADYFYVWLRLALAEFYPEYFGPEYSPKSMEAVSNTARHPGQIDGRKEADVFYQRLLTECWREAGRILKPGGLLAFTFHHNEDHAWVSVLESLFDAGFTLSATYPIRGDESKGDKAQFGSQKIEYDIIHVCRRRYEEPKPISWPKLRRQVLQDVREIKELLEHHQAEGLPEADLQVIRRGKALEYFSRHYGKVYKDQETPMSVLEALLGINQLLDEEAGGVKEPPPHNAEPFTRMLLRLFDGKAELPRDQMQKFLRGTGSSSADFIERGWVTEQKKIFYLVPPLEIAQSWIGKQRKGLTSDYDQAMFFVGACFENSGINASETLNNPNFLPHPALGGLLTWFKSHGADSATRNAASTAAALYRSWEAKNETKTAQLSLFDLLGEDE